MFKHFTFRLYPNPTQKLLIDQTIGNTRKMYNLLLGDAIEQYKQTGKSTLKLPSFFKSREEFSYLNDTDSLAYSNTRMHLVAAYQNFYQGRKEGKNTGFPKFKSKHKDKWAYTTNNQNGTVRIEGTKIKLPKIGFVNITQHRKLPEGSTYSTVVVEKTRTNKYFVTLCCKFEQELPELALNPFMSIGLDYSSHNLYVDTNGKSPVNPQYFRKYEYQLEQASQSLSRKVKFSKNWEKARLRVAKVLEEIANCRKDFLWKLAVQIASDDSVHFVFIETLDLQEIAKHKSALKLGKSTYDNGWNMFLHMLEQELTERGKRLVRIDKWFPSSQLCSRCGKRHPEMSNLENRELVCSCGLHMNRDVNAAINIRTLGICCIMEERWEAAQQKLRTVGTTGFAYSG